MPTSNGRRGVFTRLLVACLYFHTRREILRGMPFNFTMELELGSCLIRLLRGRQGRSSLLIRGRRRKSR